MVTSTPSVKKAVRFYFRVKRFMYELDTAKRKLDGALKELSKEDLASYAVEIEQQDTVKAQGH